MNSEQSTAPAAQRDPQSMMMELMYKFAILMEYQLLDLQFAVRTFVEQMNSAIMKLDGMVSEEGKHAQEMFESIFKESEKESQTLNERAAQRVENIIEDLLSAEGTEGVSAELLADIMGGVKEPTPATEANTDDVIEGGAKDAVWSRISKKLESVCRLEERLRPQVYSLIQCLNFEDIQTQRLDHLLAGYKILNAGLMTYMKAGAQNLEGGSVEAFSKNFLEKIYKMYSMKEEKAVFDQVFREQK